MKISDNGLAIVKAFEGCLKPLGGGRFRPYRCPANVLTIGYGHTNHHAPRFDDGTVWTQAQCDDALRGDMGTFERHVSKYAPEVTVQHRFDALVSWSFNCGGPPSSAVWTYARRGDAAGTRLRLARWNKGGGRVLPGLVRRRESEADLFEGKVDEALRTAGVIRAKHGPMPQRADVPKPPAAAVARSVKRETGGAAAGTAIGTGATQIPGEDGGLGAGAWFGLALGAVIVAIAILAAVKKGRAFVADWA